jgi:hypothetical protein
MIVGDTFSKENSQYVLENPDDGFFYKWIDYTPVEDKLYWIWCQLFYIASISMNKAYTYFKTNFDQKIEQQNLNYINIILDQRKNTKTRTFYL